mmetsp:Transcript_8199/g.12693  ORF Transcript_8199/g.12693 Transcript_8199/m.12693 type:complete len:605 (-) Transcript_8199:1139-2953(-)
MSAASAVCNRMNKECMEWLNIVYKDHNPDPMASNASFTLSDTDVAELCAVATANELQKTSRGNGTGLQTIWSGMNAFAEVPVIDDANNNCISVTQQHNVGNGFAPRAPATWIKRVSSDHMRRGTAVCVSDIFSEDLCAHSQPILAEPMKLDLKPDWRADSCNFLNGQRIDAHYVSVDVWSTKALFSGSMCTPLCDPRQISMIVQSGRGVLQSPFGVLPFESGDLVQVPPHTPFCVYVQSGHVVRAIVYYSKHDLVFPDAQLNVADLNQAPFSPSIVMQCKYSFSEAHRLQSRGEYVRVQQSNGGYACYFFEHSCTAFNWLQWAHNGPLLHKVSLSRNFERIGSNKGHKDPNIWLILRHTNDVSFGVAFITGTSLLRVGDSEQGRVTYPPAYFHLNGVHEKGELVMFDRSGEAYDARKGFNEGDCLLHAAGVGHGGDKDIVKFFICKAMVKYILQHSKCEQMLKTMINQNQWQRFMNMEKVQRKQRIDAYVCKMYASNFSAHRYDDAQNMECNVQHAINMAMNVILNDHQPMHAGDALQALGVPFGAGYLLVECRDVPIIPKPKYNSSFGRVKAVSYGMEVATLVNDANEYLRKLNEQNFIRSTL